MTQISEVQKWGSTGHKGMESNLLFLCFTSFWIQTIYCTFWYCTPWNASYSIHFLFCLSKFEWGFVSCKQCSHHKNEFSFVNYILPHLSQRGSEAPESKLYMIWHERLLTYKPLPVYSKQTLKIIITED